MKKQTALSNERRVQQILVSGSAVLSQKNSAGVRIARKTKAIPQPPIVKGYTDLSNIPSDNYGNLTEAGLLNIDELDGGIITGKLERAKYDNAELRKSIDTSIFELIPQTPIQLPDTVLRSVYNVVTQSVNDLTIEVAVLTNEVSTLNSDIQELEIVSESLKIEADNERLKANIAQQQTTVANKQVGETTIDLSNAIQNSINEAIQRVSLTARTQALLQENENLREQLFGLAAQTAEGASSGASNNFTVKVNKTEKDSTYDLKDTTTRKRVGNSGWEAKCNISIEVSNVSSTLKITKINFTKLSGEPLFKPNPTSTLSSLTVDSEKSVTFKLQFESNLKTYQPTKWYKSARDYDAQYEVSVTFDDGTTDTVPLSARVRKNTKGD